MVTHELLVKAAGAVLTGLVGVSAYETLRKALGTAPIRRASVTVMEWGLRGTRRGGGGRVGPADSRRRRCRGSRAHR